MLKICLTICTYLSFTLAINGDADKAKLWRGEDAIVVKGNLHIFILYSLYL